MGRNADEASKCRGARGSWGSRCLGLWPGYGLALTWKYSFFLPKLPPRDFLVLDCTSLLTGQPAGLVLKQQPLPM